MSTVGILLQPTASSSGALLTELYLENTCPLSGALELVGNEPPDSGQSVTLTR
ncbi:MAG TPA: hypothetical protein VGL86_19715 [Polyangia bacterium]